MNEWKKLQKGLIYNDFDDDLFQRRIVAKRLFHDILSFVNNKFL